MTLEATLLAWSGLALLVTLTPGPDVLLVAGHAARRGRRQGLLAVAGIVTGGLWYMLLCGFGFLTVLTASPALFAAVKFAGALYLAFLGVQLIRGAIRPSNGEDRAKLLPAPFWQGLITNALNPKVALFYVAALPQFTDDGPGAPLLGMALIAIHYAMSAVVLAALAIGASQATRVAGPSSLWRWLEGALGAAFLGIAGKLAAERV